LTFQIFTPANNSQTWRDNFPPDPKSIEETVDSIERAIGPAGNTENVLGFAPGPISFDHSDEQVRDMMRRSFDLALKKKMAVSFHLDDSMFWGRLKNLNTRENTEWLDWKKTPSTGRQLKWSTKATKIMPQLCYNSPAVKEEVRKRAALIGAEVQEGMRRLKAAGQSRLFAGVMSGWETQMGRDFATDKPLGYCALANKGFSAAKPPADFEREVAEVVREFVEHWTASLVQGGVPQDKIFSHIAFVPETIYEMQKFADPGRKRAPYLEMSNFSDPRVAFGTRHLPGFSTYPMMGQAEEIQEERQRRGNPAWASCEGTAIDPFVAEKGGKGISMETYLGGMYNKGAVLVNIFGWAVGPPSNPFRKVAENPDAIQAYRKFLRGEKLVEGVSQAPTRRFFAKMGQLKQKLPPYVQANGPSKVQQLYEALNKDVQAQRFADAERSLDRLLEIVGAKQ